MTSIFQSPEIESADVLVSKYSFTLQDIDQEVVIRVFRDLRSNRFHHSLSHHIKAPGQADPHTHGRSCESEDDVLRSVIENTILTHYREAVKAKHKPDKSWLVPNENF